MRDCSRARYATAAVIDLAHQGASGPVTLADIAQRQGISVSYLEQLFACLRSAGLLKSVRGPGGGYVLARAGEHITLAHIYEAVAERGPARKTKHAQPSQAQIKTEALWMTLDKAAAGFLEKVTVEDVVRGTIDGQARPHLTAVNQ